MEFVDYLDLIPLCVRRFFDMEQYVDSREDLKEHLEDWEEFTKEEQETIIAFYDTHDLYGYDLKTEYE